MKTDESVDLVSDPMIAREVLDIHKKLMRNPVFRIRFWLALAWQRIKDSPANGTSSTLHELMSGS
ncbi:MAG: hypothetical protein EBS90_13255 [Betaproteobacteria bacterium]|nr:hypothetical protein [Betaproteobacteria bacterium]